MVTKEIYILLWSIALSAIWIWQELPCLPRETTKELSGTNAQLISLADEVVSIGSALFIICELPDQLIRPPDGWYADDDVLHVK